MTNSFRRLTILLACTTILALPAAARAQATDDDDTVFRPAVPDFTLISLPTDLALAKYKSAFRVTHRFLRPLGEGDFGDLASDFFGLDSGAQIGLEYRFGIVPHGQIGIHRTSDKTIQFFGEYEIAREGKKLPIGISATATVEGTNNFQDAYTPSLGAIVSWSHAEHVALYLEPMWVHNANRGVNDDPRENTFLVGVGARVRIRPTVYVVAESAPRASGYGPGVPHGSFAIEKRAGGHVFQLNFSDSFGTTMGQIARGGLSSSDWYMGFNISRKFY